jgi:SAM-dependent methyltransferase
MYSKSARYYDLIYSFKDYTTEAQKLVKIICDQGHPEGSTLLDIASGTGKHLDELKEHFSCEGMDINPDMLTIARSRHPELTFYQRDMIDFNIGKQYEIIICLFSSIGYVKTLANFNRSITCMANHLARGGILLIEPWFSSDTWYAGKPHAVFIDEPDIKLARISTSLPPIDGISILEMHYLVGDIEKTEHFCEIHELGLFETEDMLSSLRSSGLDADYHAEGLTGRGLLIGKKIS